MIAKILGSNIFYESNGEGLPILFVHGLGGTGNVWHAQRGVFQKFFKVITLDLPGSGRSEKTERSYSMERWADQIVGLMDHLQLEKVVLVGHSMSTILTQKVAGKYGSRLAGLVLCGPLTEPTATAKEAFTKRAEQVLKEGMIGVADLVLAGALTAATREGNASLAGLFREVLLSNDPAHYAAQVGALIAGSAKADQAKIRCSTLILVGDQDVVTPLANCREIAASVPTARIEIIPATAHLTMMERPEFFNRALMQFLAGL